MRRGILVGLAALLLAGAPALAEERTRKLRRERRGSPDPAD